jgi:hypothetical protein
MGLQSYVDSMYRSANEWQSCIIHPFNITGIDPIQLCRGLISITHTANKWQTCTINPLNAIMLRIKLNNSYCTCIRDLQKFMTWRVGAAEGLKECSNMKMHWYFTRKVLKDISE